MKALFVHDHYFYITPSGTIYSPGKLPYRIWQRYLLTFDELVVVGRSRFITEKQSKRMNVSSGKGVTFVFVPNIANVWGMLWHRKMVEHLLTCHISKVDAVIARYSLLGGFAASLAKKNGKLCAVEVVADAWDAYWNYGNLKGRIYAPVAWYNMRRCLHKADFAIYVTREHLQRRYPCKGYCANASDVEINPVDVSVLHQKIERRHRMLKSPKRFFKVGLVGSLVNRYKGLHVALRALRRLKDQGILLELHVLGEGNLEPWRLEAKALGIANLLHLHGTLPSGEPVNQWLDELDMYVQPSFMEGLPRALLEAMSRGLPALGSTCGGMPELLQEECLHRPGDDETLAEHLRRLTNDTSWFNLQANRNFQEAQNYYLSSIEAKRLLFWEYFAEKVSEHIRVT
jgi:glycosyltransferase involved in cell wall biosynthesis